jgi:hypothetical protein
MIVSALNSICSLMTRVVAHVCCGMNIQLNGDEVTPAAGCIMEHDAE